MEPAFIFIGFILLAIVIRLISGSIDGDRVEKYIRGMGCELIDKSWAPFGPGWFGEQESRIYEIIYRDPQGLTHRAHVKTSMFSGVYLTNDQIVGGNPGQSVEAEKADLRRRLAELENQ
ncbi:hypothetical protein [Luteolibacter sp. AS25]|uniref:hypothetical protein n=1 Tax=Luteolibacter sp. AS25 TaxID=3135776 RepID=UPI00398AC467